MPTKNFTNKLEALIAQNTGGNKFRLGDQQLNEVLALVNEYSYIDMCRESSKVIGLSAPSQGSITLLKAPNVSLTTKTKIGGKDPVITKTDAVSIFWSKPTEAAEAITAFDRERGLGSVLAAFLAKASESGKNARELSGFKALAAEDTKKTANTLSASITGEALRTRILEEAVKLTKLKDDNQGIDFIPTDSIIIFIDPLTAIDLEKIVGDWSKEVWTNGVLTQAQFGGFRFVVNPFLSRVATSNPPKVIITTNFVYASFLGIIYAGAEQLPASADTVARYEQAVAEGFIYNNLVKCLY